MSKNNNKDLSKAPLLHILLSTGLGTGFVPFAPGTAGALMALGIWWAGYILLSPTSLFWATLVTIIVVTIIGTWTSGVMEQYWGKDPRAVVIDEYIGVWIPCLIAPCGDKTLLLSLLGFGLFRIIDIFKPLGCGWIDKNVKGGWGVMLDDALAGVYSLLIVWGVKNMFLV